MIRRLIFAGCISLWGASAFAEGVQIELLGEPSENASDGIFDETPAKTSGTASTQTASTPSPPSSETGSGASAAPPSGATSKASEDSTAVSKMPGTYSGKLEYGHGLYLKGDYQGALVAYNAAKETKSTDPTVLYFIACVQAKLAKYDEALSTLAALRTICGEKLASLNARGFVLAAYIEEMRSNLDNAELAWTAYKQFVSSHSGIPSFVATADARLSVIAKKRALEEQYKIVRERITSSQ